MRMRSDWGRWAMAGGVALAALAWVLIATGCGQQVSSHGDLLVLNWKAEPEFGGIYEAQRLGLLTKPGLSLELGGGPGAPVIQMIDSGTATFGVASADEVVMARARGADIVAVFATYQTCPQGLMAHGERGLKDLAAVFQPGGGVVAVEAGLPYVKMLEAKYGFGQVKVVPYTYSNALWTDDPNMVQQCFVTSEPIAARRTKAWVQVFLIADSGYNPYTAVVVTRGQTVRQQPGKVKALVAALRTGWQGYLRDPKPANAAMEALNPSMDDYTFTEAARVQQALIEDAETVQHGLGSMTVARWQALIEQLQEIKVIEKAPKAADCFVDVDALPDKP